MSSEDSVQMFDDPASVRQHLLSEMRREVIQVLDSLSHALNNQGHSLRLFPETEPNDVDYFDWPSEDDRGSESTGLRISVGLDSEVRLGNIRSAVDTE
jgi:hypothetical protein